ILIPIIPLAERPTIFPYTTLFRSAGDERDQDDQDTAESVENVTDVPEQRRGLDNGWRNDRKSQSQRQDCGAGENQAGSAVLPLRSEEHTSELQSHLNLVCRLLLEQ